MGSFSATCGVSDLAIGYGDPIVMIVLAKNRYYDETDDLGVLYPSGEWGPVGLPFFGTYDDYGRIEGIEENAATAFTLSLLQKHITPDLGRRGRSETPVDPDGPPGPLTLGDICDRAINRRHYRHQGDRLNLKRMFVHRRVYDFLVYEQTFEGFDRSQTPAFFDDRGPGRVRAELKKMLDKQQADIDDAVAAGYPRDLAVAKAEMNGYEIRRMIGGGEGQQFLGGDDLLEFDPELLLAEWPQVMTLHIALTYLRKTYRPVNTVGEQYTPPDRPIDYLKMVSALAMSRVEAQEAEEAADEADEIEAIIAAPAES